MEANAGASAGQPERSAICRERKDARPRSHRGRHHVRMPGSRPHERGHTSFSELVEPDVDNSSIDLGEYYRRAADFLREGDYDNAFATYSEILEIDPAQPTAWLAVSSAARSSGRQRNAVDRARQAAIAMRDSGRFDGLADLAHYLQDLGETRFATHIIERANWSDVSAHPDVAASLAQCLGLADQHVDALRLLDFALARHGATPGLSYLRAMTLRHLGRGEEATAEFQRCLSLAPDYAAAMLMLAGHDAEADAAAQTARIRQALAHPQLDDTQRMLLDYALFTQLDAAGDAAAAWPALEEGMRLKRAKLAYDAAAEQATYDAMTALCDARFLEGTASEPLAHTPVFVFGMPRTGTTVLERLLSNHSRVASAGELDDFHHQLCWEADVATRQSADPKLLEAAASMDFSAIGRSYVQRTHWRAGKATHLVDKHPRNAIYAGFIHKALPQAKMVCLLRDPLDSTFSNLRELFAGDHYPYSYDALETAAHVVRFRDLLAHWDKVMPGAVLVVRYEELVREPERIMRLVLEHCGLPFEPACADLASNAAPSATASSSQVRQPLHTRSIGAWKRYAKPLAAAEAFLRERLPDSEFAGSAH